MKLRSSRGGNPNARKNHPDQRIPLNPPRSFILLLRDPALNGTRRQGVQRPIRKTDWWQPRTDGQRPGRSSSGERTDARRRWRGWSERGPRKQGAGHHGRGLSSGEGRGRSPGRTSNCRGGPRFPWGSAPDRIASRVQQVGKKPVPLMNGEGAEGCASRPAQCGPGASRGAGAAVRGHERSVD